MTVHGGQHILLPVKALLVGIESDLLLGAKGHKKDLTLKSLITVARWTFPDFD